MFTKNNLFFWSLTFVFLVGVLSFGLAQASEDRDMKGWGWSGNVGWFSYKGNDGYSNWTNGPYLDSSGHLKGYAWSEHIGWINLAPESGYPNSPNHGAKLMSDDGGETDVVGWVRACSVFASGCSGELKSDFARGGWDGWIKMSGGWSNGVKLQSAIDEDGESRRYFEGYAWGDLVVGWLDMGRIYVVDEFTDVRPFSANCWAGGDPDNNVTIVEGGLVTWHATINYGSTPFHYQWQGHEPLADSSETETNNRNIFKGPLEYGFSGDYSGQFSVRENGGQSTVVSCSNKVIVRQDIPDTYYLTVKIKGKGKGWVESLPKGFDEDNCKKAEYTATEYEEIVTCGPIPFSEDEEVSLSAIADESVFSRWEDDCAGNGSSCSLDMDENKVVTAVFNKRTCTPADVTFTQDCQGKTMSYNNQEYCLTEVNKPGDGKVSSVPAPVFTQGGTQDLIMKISNVAGLPNPSSIPAPNGNPKALFNGSNTDINLGSGKDFNFSVGFDNRGTIASTQSSPYNGIYLIRLKPETVADSECDLPITENMCGSYSPAGMCPHVILRYTDDRTISQ